MENHIWIRKIDVLSLLKAFIIGGKYSKSLENIFV